MVADPDRTSIRGRIWLAIGVLATIGGAYGAVELFGAKIASLFAPEETNTVQLNRTQACLRGALERWETLGYWSSETVLGSDARHLTICDTQPITATPTAMARDLAKAYPGCLTHVSHLKLIEMHLNADAICRVETQSGPRFFCLGSEKDARQRPSDRVADATQIPVCSDLFLDDIGFSDD